MSGKEDKCTVLGSMEAHSHPFLKRLGQKKLTKLLNAILEEPKV